MRELLHQTIRPYTDSIEKALHKLDTWGTAKSRRQVMGDVAKRDKTEDLQTIGKIINAFKGYKVRL